MIIIVIMFTVIVASLEKGNGTQLAARAATETCVAGSLGIRVVFLDG